MAAKEKKAAAQDESRFWSAIAYLIPFVGGLALYVLKTDDKYARYHAMQSVTYWIAYVAAWIVAVALSLVPLLFWLPSLVQLAASLAALFLAWKAWRGERYSLPYIGPVTEKYA